jgi:hypothetical protein
MTKEEFFPVIGEFLEFYDHKFSDTQTKIWFNTFEPYSIEIFSNALSEHIAHDEFPGFPAIGKIMKNLPRAKVWTPK